MSRTPRHRATSGPAARPLDQEAYNLLLEAAEGQAELHVLATMHALELHQWLASRLGYSPEIPYTLEVAPDDHDAGDEAAEHLPAAGSDDPRALLGGLGLSEGSRLFYDLDQDGWGCNLTVRAVIDRAPGADYPLVTSWQLPHAIDPTAGGGGDDGDDDEHEALDDDLQELEGLILEALQSFNPAGEDDGDVMSPRPLGSSTSVSRKNCEAPLNSGSSRRSRAGLGSYWWCCHNVVHSQAPPVGHMPHSGPSNGAVARHRSVLWWATQPRAP